ncbi:hypothetical protein MTO96_006024 [Rhipicephalus appendiculatus]
MAIACRLSRRCNDSCSRCPKRARARSVACARRHHSPVAVSLPGAGDGAASTADESGRLARSRISKSIKIGDAVITVGTVIVVFALFLLSPYFARQSKRRWSSSDCAYFFEQSGTHRSAAGSES